MKNEKENTKQVLVVAPKEGRLLMPGGLPHVVKLDSTATDGGFELYAVELDSGMEGPSHIHHKDPETFYILEGEVQFMINDGIVNAEPGTTVHVPPGALHGLKNSTSTKARMLVIVAPAGVEEFFNELDQLYNDQIFDLKKIMEVANKYNTEFVVPE